MFTWTVAEVHRLYINVLLIFREHIHLPMAWSSKRKTGDIVIVMTEGTSQRSLVA